MGVAYLPSKSLLPVICRTFGGETPSLQFTTRMRDVGHEYLVSVQGPRVYRFYAYPVLF